jgi:hypothetical protein
MSLRQAQPARATIRDVAAQAGVSVSSVSRVMNGEPHISPELHARIMRAVNRLRFEPHSAAQALRSRESKTIGCMVADLSNPLYSEMINGAEEEFQRAGYVLMLAATRHEQDRETAFVSAVRRRRMDGLLLFAGDNAHTDFTGALANLDLPCVAIDREVPRIPSVRADHRGGGLEITRYLIGLGHRRIALLTGRAALLPSSERLAGYRPGHYRGEARGRSRPDPATDAGARHCVQRRLPVLRPRPSDRDVYVRNAHAGQCDGRFASNGLAIPTTCRWCASAILISPGVQRRVSRPDMGSTVRWAGSPPTSCSSDSRRRRGLNPAGLPHRHASSFGTPAPSLARPDCAAASPISTTGEQRQRRTTKLKTKRETQGVSK